MSERKVYKKSGFVDGGGLFWVNRRGKYGMRYQCKTCGKVSLGTSGAQDPRMHWSSCSEISRKDEP